MRPIELAQRLCAELESHGYATSVEKAGTGSCYVTVENADERICTLRISDHVHPRCGNDFEISTRRSDMYVDGHTLTDAYALLQGFFEDDRIGATAVARATACELKRDAARREAETASRARYQRERAMVRALPDGVLAAAVEVVQAGGPGRSVRKRLDRLAEREGVNADVLCVALREKSGSSWSEPWSLVAERLKKET